ncbi:hypothetical protein CPB83DRAFT_856843 [Crepidotus variabilis]|uniref:Uncharacterized protein n=1 Tax=Crepidotus variabilis TaxID=179855 RepID=A0A9P6EE71_9AGAR|nr:hypothetical protein CPB83DRAFT_856843 [Crepidotus variabilis]
MWGVKRFGVRMQFSLGLVLATIPLTAQLARLKVEDVPFSPKRLSSPRKEYYSQDVQPLRDTWHDLVRPFLIYPPATKPLISNFSHSPLSSLLLPPATCHLPHLLFSLHFIPLVFSTYHPHYMPYNL